MDGIRLVDILNQLRQDIIIYELLHILEDGNGCRVYWTVPKYRDYNFLPLIGRI